MKPSQRGFTLIELLVVIGILGLLVVAFLPDLTSASLQGEITATNARLVGIKGGVEAFERRGGGVYPPDDFRDPEGKIRLKTDNGVNTGIESMVAFIGHRRGVMDLTEHEDWLANTDSDDNGAVIPRLDRSARVEIVDVWGTPLLYFVAQSGAMDRTERIRLPEQSGGDEITGRAWKNPETGTYLGRRKYQLVSAGPNKIFNDDDDLTFPELPPK